MEEEKTGGNHCHCGDLKLQTRGTSDRERRLMLTPKASFVGKECSTTQVGSSEPKDEARVT